MGADKMKTKKVVVKNMTVPVTCEGCSAEFKLEVNEDDYKKWQKGTLIQNALPYLTSWERELFISATCHACWDKLFAEGKG
jgi:hypothetical protein